ncbi:MAG: hypothetical protein AAF267_01510 [Deinococcota bacterium]
MNPLDDIAKALLTKATALPEITDGRTGEGGIIPSTPYIEVGDGRGQVQGLAAGAGMDDLTAQFFVIAYERFNGSDPAPQKETLRKFYWDYYGALRADYTLGDLCEEARVTGFDADLTKRNNVEYWYFALTVEVRLEIEP